MTFNSFMNKVIITKTLKPSRFVNDQYFSNRNTCHKAVVAKYSKHQYPFDNPINLKNTEHI